MRRTRERRALDALLRLGVLNADRLTDDDVKVIALCLRGVRVADDAGMVESMIAVGGALLPEMCVNDHARMIGADGRVLGMGAGVDGGVGRRDRLLDGRGGVLEVAAKACRLEVARHRRAGEAAMGMAAHAVGDDP